MHVATHTAERIEIAYGTEFTNSGRETVYSTRHGVAKLAGRASGSNTS
jgi:hypothetical protein